MSRRMLALCLGMVCLLKVSLSFAMPVTPKNAVTLVEYYDYECPHCRKMSSVIERLQREYPTLNIIHRVTPVLTPTSRVVASFTLAVPANMRKRLHQILMY